MVYLDLMRRNGMAGTSMTTGRRRDLKPKKPMSDAQLLAQAARDAARWQENKRRGRI